MPDYPITEDVHDAMRCFPAIADAITIPYSGRSELEIVHLLNNTNCGNILQLLQFLNDHLPSSGNIGKHIAQATEYFKFSQALAEFYLLVHLQGCSAEVQAKASIAKSLSEKHYDIDLTTNGLNAHVEIYCPVDFYGYQLAEQQIRKIFKYLDVNMGFDINLRLVTSETLGSYVYEFGKNEKTIQEWLTSLGREAKQWLKNARAGNCQQFRGPTEKICLSAILDKVHERKEQRNVVLDTPTKSTDSRLFFEVDKPEDTAASQWGKKLVRKLKKRQCGDPDPNCLRMLVIDFLLADTSFRDFICWENFTERFSRTLRLLAAKAGPPLPYDAVLPARLSEECCFGRIVTLDEKRMKEVEQLVRAARLNRPCVPSSF